MTMNPSGQKDSRPKIESEPDYSHLPKITSSRQWSSYKNPRIVRVSKTFGGKDRHSKVCTVRGLRDRRIRLSVPTAIQLYDLQDRLGLSQPSKVVDWLLDATKHDIDKLPPLPMLPASFTAFHHHPTAVDCPDFSSSSSHLCSGEKMSSESAECFNGFVAQNLFPVGHQNPYLHWDLHSLSLSHFGGGGGFSFSSPSPSSSDQQQQQFHNSLSTAAALASSSQQLYFCPSVAAAPTVTVPPFISTSYINNNPSAADSDNLRQTNQGGFPTTMRQFLLNVNSKTMEDNRR